MIALGSGLALLAVRRTNASGYTHALVAASGSAAATSAVFGNPLVPAVLFLEVAGLARRETMLLVLPCLVSSGVGALVFTGLGDWTGLDIGALAIPDLEPAGLDLVKVAWTLPMAAVVAVATWSVFALGRRTARLAVARPVVVTVAAGLLTGCAAAGYAVATGHSPADVALSGQATLPALATHPEQWPAGALVLLLVGKGIAYAVCLGTFRGGPVFPAVFLGATFRKAPWPRTRFSRSWCPACVPGCARPAWRPTSSGRSPTWCCARSTGRSAQLVQRPAEGG